MPSRRDFAAFAGMLVCLAGRTGLMLSFAGCSALGLGGSTTASVTHPVDAASDPVPPPEAAYTSQRVAAARRPVPVLPSAAEARRLATISFMTLARSIKSRNFSQLYQGMAPSFRSAVSLRQVADGFRPFTDSGIDLTTSNPNLLTLTAAPALSQEGVLIVRGVQPTPTQDLRFEFGFLNDGRGWAPTALSLSSTGG